MASESEILELRQLVNETGEDCSWTDEELGAVFDGSESLHAAASRVWYLKAGRYASLVDVTESGSSRKLGDLYKNAQAMGKLYDGMDEEEEAIVADVPVISRIRRTVA